MGVFIDELKLDKTKKYVDDLFLKMTKPGYDALTSQEFEGAVITMYYLGILNFENCVFLQKCESVLLDLKIREL